MKRLPHGRPRKVKPPRGHYGRVWLSKEFLLWCRRHQLKPKLMASCILHTHALNNPGVTPVRIVSERPFAIEEYLDPEAAAPGDGEEAE